MYGALNGVQALLMHHVTTSIRWHTNGCSLHNGVFDTLIVVGLLGETVRGNLNLCIYTPTVLLYRKMYRKCTRRSLWKFQITGHFELRWDDSMSGKVT